MVEEMLATNRAWVYGRSIFGQISEHSMNGPVQAVAV